MGLIPTPSQCEASQRYSSLALDITPSCSPSGTWAPRPGNACYNPGVQELSCNFMSLSTSLLPELLGWRAIRPWDEDALHPAAL